MDERLFLKINQFKQPRLEGTEFTLSESEEALIVEGLDRVQAVIPSETKILLTLSKVEGFFHGSFGIRALHIFAFAKEKTIPLLCARLEQNIKIQIKNSPYLIKNPRPIEIHL
ncbi:MAG: hypothetical protein ACOVP4_11300 [Bacteriovoracaceae bacterium]|jgi:hypothetical protein